VDYAGLVAGLPAALAPPPAAPRPEGAFAARLGLSGPLATPAAWTVDAALDLSALRAAARRGPPPPLAAPFVHHPDPADPRRELRVGPENPEFVPLADLPEHVVRAVTTSEDAGFFGHSGFDFEELRNALAEGAEAGRVVRGGSTITQQLAKNLFLSPERTLARKVREAVITIGLEASLPKRRLLEIYLNVAEWGPGLWGIGPAARHWFGKDARELTAKEAAFLASIIPSPIRYHAMYERGFPSDRWEARVNDLLFKMTEQGALSDDQLLEGLEAPLQFTGG
jgi:monofunctional biosynthetic peptidoglycan transglycosylase